MSEIVTNQIQNGTEPKSGPDGGPEKKKKTKKLGHEELLRLLSVFEGELQARDEAIQILKQQVRQANTAREALKRDANYTNASDDEKTGNSVNQLKSIIEHQKDSLRKVKREMCLTDEKLNILTEELEREKLKHSDYMEKSDEFVNLLETDRQKLKLALEKEKALNDGQVRQYEKLKRETSEEIDKLKKFSMLLVEEKQSAMKREERHNERIKAAESEIQELEEALETLLKKYEAEQEHSNTLEGELEELSDRQQQEIADLETKLEQEKKKTNELEEQLNIKQAQVNKLKAMHKNLRRTDDHLLQLKEKLEKEGDREDLEAEVIQLRERIEELEEGEKNQLNEAEFRKQIENEIKAIEDLENELDRLRKTALIHKQIERFVEDSMFKLDELTARHDFEEKKTLDMETGIQTLKTNLTELDEGSAKIMLIEEDLRKEFRLIEEESKKEKGLEVGNAMMAAVIQERDELQSKCKSLQSEFNELQEATLNHAREGMRSIPSDETANISQVSELKKQLEDQSEVVMSLEAEIKKLNHQAKMKLQGSSEDITNFEIKLLATEEDLEATKTLLKKEEAKTAKQSLQVKMLKERLMKLEEIEEKYKHQVEQVRKTNKKSNEASLEETNMRRQLDDIKTVLEEEVKDRKLIEKELKSAKKILKNYEKEASKAEIGIQTDEEYPSRPTSRISERFGAISPAIQIFDGPRAHRIVPGGFRGCNFSAGMQQESLVRPSSIKQQRIKIPPPASTSSSDKQISMTFVHDINDASGNSDNGSSGKDDRKCVLKITKDKQTGAPVIVPNAAPQSPPTQSSPKLSPPQSGPQHVALKTKENNQQTIKLVKNEQSGKIQVSQEVTHIGQTEPSAPIGRNVTSTTSEESESKMSEIDLDSKKSKSPEKSQKIYTKVERVRKKRNVFERAASAFEKADQVQKTSRRFIQSTMESASEKTSKLGKQEVSDMVVEASSTFSRNGSVRTSKRSVRSHSRQSSLAGDVSDGHISTSVHIAGASSGVTLSKSISTESITSGRTSKTGSSSLSNLSSISTPSPTALNNSATKPIQQNDATKIEEESVAEKEADAARSQACMSPDSDAKARGRGRSQGRRRSHSKNRESSLVRQRAAQWKEKEALGGRLPIPVPKAKD